MKKLLLLLIASLVLSGCTTMSLPKNVEAKGVKVTYNRFTGSFTLEADSYKSTFPQTTDQD